jgi:hypothetical protein
MLLKKACKPHKSKQLTLNLPTLNLPTIMAAVATTIRLTKVSNQGLDLKVKSLTDSKKVYDVSILGKGELKHTCTCGLYRFTEPMYLTYGCKHIALSYDAFGLWENGSRSGGLIGLTSDEGSLDKALSKIATGKAGGIVIPDDVAEEAKVLVDEKKHPRKEVKRLEGQIAAAERQIAEWKAQIEAAEEREAEAKEAAKEAAAAAAEKRAAAAAATDAKKVEEDRPPTVYETLSDASTQLYHAQHRFKEIAEEIADLKQLQKDAKKAVTAAKARHSGLSVDDAKSTLEQIQSDLAEATERFAASKEDIKRTKADFKATDAAIKKARKAAEVVATKA